MTRQREQIYAVIAATPRHMTAEEIFDAARMELPGIARATVYRNLGLMERDGQVRRVRIADAPDRYDRTLAPHGHIRCPRCGALEDMALPGLEAQIERSIGRPVQGWSLQVQALCRMCMQKEQETGGSEQ